MQTNRSGKFAIPEESPVEEVVEIIKETAEPEVDAAIVIPPVPVTAESLVCQYMNEIRRLFGELWWLWLVFLFWYLAKDK